jgi:hypothetical protein
MARGLLQDNGLLSIKKQREMVNRIAARNPSSTGAAMKSSNSPAPIWGADLFVFTHYPTHRSGIRNQSSGLISPRRRFALLLEMR